MLSYPKVLKESIIETGLDRHQELTLELCRRKVMQCCYKISTPIKLNEKMKSMAFHTTQESIPQAFTKLPVCNFEDDN